MVMKTGATLAATLTEAYQSSLNRCEVASVSDAVRSCRRRGSLTAAEHQQLRAEAAAAAARIRALRAARSRQPDGAHLRTDRPRPRPEPRMFKGGAHVAGRPER